MGNYCVFRTCLFFKLFLRALYCFQGKCCAFLSWSFTPRAQDIYLRNLLIRNSQRIVMENCCVFGARSFFKIFLRVLIIFAFQGECCAFVSWSFRSQEFSYDICLLEILNVLLWEITVFFGLDYFSNFSESLNFFHFSGGTLCIFFVAF